MRILVKGNKPRVEYPKRFKCTYCGSLLDVDAYDLKYIGTQYNSAIYEFYCPVCREDRTVDEDQFNDRVAKMRRVPKQGDVYVSKCSGNPIVVIETKDDLVKSIAETYVITYTEKDFNKDYEFTGKTIDVSELANVFDKYEEVAE